MGSLTQWQQYKHAMLQDLKTEALLLEQADIHALAAYECGTRKSEYTFCDVQQQKARSERSAVLARGAPRHIYDDFVDRKYVHKAVVTCYNQNAPPTDVQTRSYQLVTRGVLHALQHL